MLLQNHSPLRNRWQGAVAAPLSLSVPLETWAPYRTCERPHGAVVPPCGAEVPLQLHRVLDLWGPGFPSSWACLCDLPPVLFELRNKDTEKCKSFTLRPVSIAREPYRLLGDIIDQQSRQEWALDRVRYRRCVQLHFPVKFVLNKLNVSSHNVIRNMGL